MFNLGKKEILGLDIGTHSIKAVQLREEKKKWSLVNYGYEEIFGDDRVLEAPPEERKERTINALSRLMSSKKFNAKKAAISVSGNSVIVRFVRFPKMTPEELSKTIQFEAEPYIPFDIRNVNISTQILGDVMEEGQKKMDTVLVAARKEIIQEKMEVLQASGLRPAVIDVDAFALENAFELNRADFLNETVILVNIGALATNINIIENGVSKVVRDLFIAGYNFTKAIQKNIQVDYMQAEKMKIETGIILAPSSSEQVNDVSNQVSVILSAVVKDLLVEIRRSIDYYNVQREGEGAINWVILSGGSACMRNLSEFISQNLGIPVEIANPLANIDTGGKAEQLGQIAHSLMVATGLALRKEGDIV